ncbi:Tm-1-like ATP-binding domain-containing protein [Variovorax sp. UC122_21]|uniref:Tm-1-like ATP-binding domain-containing protein n=1 Tax=Variovorax sp. UC122_21 TaxID=3374554 RepID=UPI0037566758
MSKVPTVLLIGTADTKSAELLFMRECIEAGGGRVAVMDVGVLDGAPFVPEITNAEVAAAAGRSVAEVAASGDENSAMTLMARGAAKLAARWHAEGRIDGLLALGGTMGTDLALEVAQALPLGVPKVVVSTIAYSHLLPPERIPPDLIMVLWAGGLYGLNSLCRSALSQAAGAVLGACRQARAPAFERPLVGMTSLGSSALTYMKTLKPALEARGYEVAVFHTTGMGGRAFEALAAEGRFCAVMDFSLQELANQLGGSCVTAGPDRLLGAGRAGTPQIVAPGAIDMLDFPAWQPVPEGLEGRPAHTHNRLLASALSAPEFRRGVATEIASRLARAEGATCVLLPLHGIEGWDRPGEPLHDPEGLAAFTGALRDSVGATRLIELDAHINDAAFCEAALQVFDAWVADGTVPAGRPA